ncbi:MAG: DUF721 domain-containing protein [Candidatus Sericytochromatia bacterium]|nr:DUF721 domain-containing protein [Candidatus Tanganyikabacteria bacterium]
MRKLRIGPVLEVVRAWPEVAGPLVSKHLQAVRFGGGILWVRAEQSVWAHQLTFLRPELLEKFEAKLGKQVVVDIRLSLASPGPGEPAPPPAISLPVPPPGRSSGPPPTVPVVELPPEQVAAIEARAAEHIKNPDLARRWVQMELRVRGAQLGRRQLGQQGCRSCGVPHPGPGDLCPVCYRQSLPPADPNRPI